jgi:YbbR domain-containing protein
MTRNPSLKMLSLGIATFLWFYLTNTVRTISLIVPYEIKGLPINRVILSSSKKPIKVKISGPSFMLSSIESSYPVFKLKVPADLQGDSWVGVFSEEDLMLPSAVQVISIQPRQVDISFDVKEVKRVTVEVPRIGVPNPDYTLDRLVVRPRKVDLIGPRSKLKKINQVETSPLDTRELRGKTELTLPVRSPMELVDVLRPQVQVLVEVNPVIVNQNYSQIPIIISGIPNGTGVVFEPSKVDIKVTGPRETLRNFYASMISGVINSEMINKNLIDNQSNEKEQGSVFIEPQFKLPKGVSLLSVNPPKIKLNLDQ